MSPIRNAAVIGAGTMGAQIAAHVANAGLPVVLLDVSAEAARQGLNRARLLKPDPFLVPESLARIRVATLEDSSALAQSDWIVEAVVENLEIKRRLAARIDEIRAPHAIVSTNTSGISVSAIAEDRSPAFRAHWLGTHFFNPPRHMHLVEVIPTSDTDPAVVTRMIEFLDRRLGKGVVIAKDSPAFIANHLGIFGLIRLLEALASGAYTIEEIDAVTGPPIGRPKTATFRTMDLVGLDVVAHVASDLAQRLPREGDRALFQLPPFVHAMIEHGLLGEKTGGGFYKRVQANGQTTILTLEVGPNQVGTYRERREPVLRSLESARALTDTGERIRTLMAAHDKAGALLRATLEPTLAYSKRVAAEIAYSTEDVDRAMRWGFGWELGPFEMLDALTADVNTGRSVASRSVSGRERSGAPALPARVLRTNPGASLLDLGDGVLGLEFHSKMNTIGGDAIELLQMGALETAANFDAFVIGNSAEHFSAGANLMLLLLEAQEENWDEIDRMVRAFQGATMALKTCAVPVVAAPAGLALGGGCEICLHCDRVQAAAETYMGLVETGVGLIPAGGGTKEMLVRSTTTATPLPAVFELIGLGRVSTSAPDARKFGYLLDVDGITMNRHRVLADAKTVALARAAAGYTAPPRSTSIPVGGPDAFATLSLGVHLAHRSGRISDHDALIGRKLAWVLSGGSVPHKTTVTEDDLLDLEREAFLSLCGERKTQDRIAFTLKTGKILRN